MIAGTTRAGIVPCRSITIVSAAAPVIAPYEPSRQFADLAFAPPMVPHVFDDQGRWQRPFVYPLRLVDRLEHKFAQDRSTRVALQWFTSRRLVTTPDGAGPWLLFGADALGRDVFSRVLHGARMSLGVALLATALALRPRSIGGSGRRFRRRRVETVLMRVSDFILVLPVIYVVHRAARGDAAGPHDVPGVLDDDGSAGHWRVGRFLRRGVRAVVAVEKTRVRRSCTRARGREVANSATTLTSGGSRFSRGPGNALLPAFILAEATLSYVGFGFAEPTPSWGVMLHEAADAGTLAEAPWLLAPAAAIVISVFALHLASASTAPPDSVV